MEEELFIIDLIEYLWKKKYIMIIAVLIGAILGFCFAAYVAKPQYSSSFTVKFTRDVVVLPDNGDEVSIGDAITQGTALYQYELYKNQSLVSVYVEYLKSRTIHEKIMKELDIEDVAYQKFLENITMFYNVNTGIINVTVTTTEAEKSNTIATMLYDLSKKEFEKEYGTQDFYTINEACVDTKPVKPSKAIYTAVFGIGFGVIAFLALYIIYFADDRITRQGVITKTTKYPLLANISKYKSETSEVISLNDSLSASAEEFRILRTNVEKLFNKNNHKTLLVTSSKDTEGVSTCASNLAVVCAMQGKKTILVDANLRSGEIASLFDVDNKIGLSEYLAKDIDEAKIITGTKQDKLSVIVSGEAPNNPSELLSNDKMSKLIEKLKGDYDIVIIDGSPLLGITDSLILAGISEEVLVVTSFRQTKKNDLEKVRNALSNIEANNVSCVFNKVEE